MFDYYIIIRELLFSLVVAIFIFIFISNRRYKFWKTKGVKYVKPYIVFGNVKDVFLGNLSLTEQIHEFYNQYKDEKYFGIYKALSSQLVIKDVEIVKQILVKDFIHFQDRFTDANMDKEIQSKNLIHLKGKTWKNLRSKLTPIFTSSKLKNMASQISERGIELQSYVKELVKTSNNFEVSELMAQFTNDVIGSCIFGLSLNSMSNQDEVFREMGRRIFRPSFKKTLKTRFRMLSSKLFYALNLTVLDREVTDFFLALIRDIKSRRREEGGAKNNFINSLFELDDTSDEFLMAQAFIFFAAGFETSSTLMSFTLYELANNLHVQDKVYDEINETLSKTDGLVSYETLKNMPYLDMVFKESLRKYPPAPFLIRECTKDWTIPGSNIIIEKGIKVLIPLYSLHRDDKFFENPESFIPERFGTIKEDSTLFMPFGDGPRNCIGKYDEPQIKKYE